MLNDPYGSQSAYRAPLLKVFSGNAELVGAVSASVTSNNYYACDHFRLEFAMNAGAPRWWDVNPPLIVDVRVSIDGGGSWVSLIVGEVDDIDVCWQTGTVEMEGRDLSARFIESKTQQAFPNNTSSEIVKILAARHPEITSTNITPTKPLVGRFYQQDHTNINLDEFCRTSTEWDLITYLARQEGFDAYMTGTTFNFVPSQPENANPFVINWTPPGPIPRLNATDIRAKRSLTIAKDIEVQVRSWNSRQERAFTKTARAIGGKAANATGQSHSGKTQNNTQRYVRVVPNLTEDQAQQLATKIAREATQHERVVNIAMPGELMLTPRNMVKVQGTSTSFDQTYYIASIDRSISHDEGFRQSLRLKNSSPRTETQV